MSVAPGQIAKIVLYALAVVVPGGGVAVAGYHLFKIIRKRRDNGKQISD